jgi:hypothetical protein
MFALNSNTLMSIVELPSQQDSNGGVTSGFATSGTQVRIILRDLSGKACWDSTNLCGPSLNEGLDIIK